MGVPENGVHPKMAILRGKMRSHGTWGVPYPHIYYKQLEKIERYSGSIAGFFLGRPFCRDRQQKCAREQHTFKRGSDVTEINKKMGVQCGVPQ